MIFASYGNSVTSLNYFFSTSKVICIKQPNPLGKGFSAFSLKPATNSDIWLHFYYISVKEYRVGESLWGHAILSLVKEHTCIQRFLYTRRSKHYHCIMTGEVFPPVQVWWLKLGSGKQISARAQRPRGRWGGHWHIESRQIWWFPRSPDGRWMETVKAEMMKKTGQAKPLCFFRTQYLDVVQFVLMKNSKDNEDGEGTMQNVWIVWLNCSVHLNNYTEVNVLCRWRTYSCSQQKCEFCFWYYIFNKSSPKL